MGFFSELEASAAMDPKGPQTAKSQPPAIKGQKAVTPAPAPEDAAKRQAHEAAEAKRKAEREAKQEKKRAAEQAQLDRLNAMSDEDAALFSVKRVSADTERLTRRNMKDRVSEHI